MAKITVKNIEKLKVGTYSVEGTRGLRLRVSETWRTFSYRRMVQGKQYEVGIGNVELGAARAEATHFAAMTDREFLQELEQRKEKPSAPMPTFKTVATQFEAWKLEVGDWEEGDPTHMAKTYMLKNHILPVIGSKRIDEVELKDVAQIALNMQAIKPTMKKTVALVKYIFDWAIAKELVSTNPADMNGPLRFLIPKFDYEQTNHGMLSVERIPEFFVEIKKHKGMLSTLLEFSILTATRSGTARKAKWEHINLKEKTWEIPRDELKVKKNGGLVVPLSTQAVKILRSIGVKKNGVIFPNPSVGIPYQQSAFSQLLRKMNRLSGGKWIDDTQSINLGKPVCITQHGLARASFMTWSQDDRLGNDRRFDVKVAHFCLHHKVDDGYNGAYERQEMKERRREMMQAWADYCYSKIAMSEQKNTG